MTKSGKNALIIGFNVHDKRPEIPGSKPKPVPEETPQETPQETKPAPTKPGRDPEPTTTTPETTKPAPTKPGRDPEPTKPTPQETTRPHRDPDPKPTKPGKDPDPTKPTPEPTKPTTPAPTTTTPETKKERSKDSVNNGGGRVGGGSTVIGTDAYEPNDPITETGKGHGDPAKETPATPTQDQSNANVSVNGVDNNRTHYETEAETQSSWKNNQGQNLITGSKETAAGSSNQGSGNSSGNAAGNSTATEGTPLTGYGEEFHLED